MAWNRSNIEVRSPDSKASLGRQDRRILALLQSEGRLSHAEIGRRIGLSPTAVADRIRDLEAEGVILGYRAIVDPARLGYGIAALVTVTCDGDRCKRLVDQVAAMPEVIDCYRVTGEASAVLKVAVGDVAELAHLIDRLALLGKPSTAVVLSAPFVGRPLALPADGA